MKTRLLLMLLAALCLPLLLGGSAFPGTAWDGSSPTDDYMAFYELFFAGDHGKEEFPEWYGGAFMNRDTHLCIQVVEGHEKMIDAIREAMGGRKVDFHTCRYSLNELFRIREALMDELEERAESGSYGWNSLLTSQAENQLVLRIAKNEEGERLMASLQGKYPCLVFEYSGTNVTFSYSDAAPETPAMDGGTLALLLILPAALLAAAAALRLLPGRKRREGETGRGSL